MLDDFDPDRAPVAESTPLEELMTFVCVLLAVLLGGAGAALLVWLLH